MNIVSSWMADGLRILRLRNGWPILMVASTRFSWCPCQSERPFCEYENHSPVAGGNTSCLRRKSCPSSAARFHRSRFNLGTLGMTGMTTWVADDPSEKQIPITIETNNMMKILMILTSHRSEEHTSELQSPCNLVC